MSEPVSKSGGSTATLLETPFQIDTIAQVPAPDGSDAVWHRYVISQGTNTIVGLRAGMRTEVVIQIEEMVARLNERLGKIRSKTR